jgi:hypothetical protein
LKLVERAWPVGSVAEHFTIVVPRGNTPGAVAWLHVTGSGPRLVAGRDGVGKSDLDGGLTRTERYLVVVDLERGRQHGGTVAGWHGCIVVMDRHGGDRVDGHRRPRGDGERDVERLVAFGTAVVGDADRHRDIGDAGGEAKDPIGDVDVIATRAALVRQKGHVDRACRGRAQVRVERRRAARLTNVDVGDRQLWWAGSDRHRGRARIGEAVGIFDRDRDRVGARLEVPVGGDRDRAGTDEPDRGHRLQRRAVAVVGGDRHLLDPRAVDVGAGDVHGRVEGRLAGCRAVDQGHLGWIGLGGDLGAHEAGRQPASAVVHDVADPHEPPSAGVDVRIRGERADAGRGARTGAVGRLRGDDRQDITVRIGVSPVAECTDHDRREDLQLRRPVFVSRGDRLQSSAEIVHCATLKG